MNRYWLILAALWTLAAAPTAAAETLIIGASLSLTGKYAELGGMNKMSYGAEPDYHAASAYAAGQILETA